MKRKKVLNTLLVLLLTFSLLLPVFAADSAQILVKTSAGELKAGEEVKVSVDLKNNPGFLSAVFKIDYDSTKLELKSIDTSYGLVVGDKTVNVPYLDNVYYAPNKDDNKVGLMRGSPIEEDCTLFSLTFLVKDNAKAGKTEVRVTATEMFAEGGAKIPTNSLPGTVSIAGDTTGSSTGGNGTTGTPTASGGSTGSTTAGGGSTGSTTAGGGSTGSTTAGGGSTGSTTAGGGSTGGGETGGGTTGVTVSGEVLSYNPQNETTIQLKQGNDVKYTVCIEEEEGKEEVKQAFSIPAVVEGTYDLVVTKAAHLTYTVTGVKVGSKNLDLTAMEGKAYQLIELLCGNVNDGTEINADDLNIVWNDKNFSKSVGVAGLALADLNGDGMVNAVDLNIVWNDKNFNKGIRDCTFDFEK